LIRTITDEAHLRARDGAATTAAARSEFAKLQIPLPDLQMRAAERA
jgi:hypothetical protein